MSLVPGKYERKEDGYLHESGHSQRSDWIISLYLFTYNALMYAYSPPLTPNFLKNERQEYICLRSRKCP